MSTARILVLSVLLALLFAYLLHFGITSLHGASDDLFPPWVLARLAVTGHRADTYDLATQLALFDDPTLPGYRWMVKDAPQIRGIGICPYPPTAVVVYAPLGLLSFDAAGLVVYFGSIAMALVAAGIISRITAGRIGMLLACVAILYDPAFNQVTLPLGQNGPLTLVLLAAGWLAVCRGRELTAGLCWGLFAYKPQWLLAVGWLPLAIGRPRIWVGMAVTAGLLAAAATAWLGPDAWSRWLTQLAAVDHVYATDAEFHRFQLPLGCDLRSVAYRYFIPAIARPLGWAAIGLVAAATTIWNRMRPAAGVNAPEAVGLLFACGLTVPHLYYYDEMVFVLPLLVLWSHRARLARWQLGGLIALTAMYYAAYFIFMLSRWIEQPPVWTVTVVGFWALALTVKSEGSKSWPSASTAR
jgi:hypothetical protein